MLEAVYVNICFLGCQRLFMRAFRFLSFYYSLQVFILGFHSREEAEKKTETF